MSRPFYLALLTINTLLLISGTARAQEGFGGVRSNGNVRDQIHAGYVPLPETFAEEGLLAEHNFPVREERCDGPLCVFSAMGHGVHQATQTRSAYLFIEPISGLKPGQFKRLPQNLSLVIDRSGSMSGWKMAAALEAAHALIDQLNGRDRISIVAFDTDAELVIPSSRVRNKAALHRAVDRIAAGGSTNIYDAMALGYRQLARHTRPGRGSRLIIMTDERPNVGSTSKGGFLELAGAYAKKGVALSICGVGLDLGTNLAFSVSQLRGGSYHYLENADEIDRLFRRDLASLLTPVAYDMVLEIKPGPGLRVAGIYGVPKENRFIRKDGTAVLRAATVFFDKRRSGAVIRLEPEPSCPNAALDAAARLSWSCVLAHDESEFEGGKMVSHRATELEAMAEFKSADHYRGYALVNFVELMKRALVLWHGGSRAKAVDTLLEARAILDLDARIIRDAELMKERKMADDLLIAMSGERSSYKTCQPRSSCGGRPVIVF
ncbi:MAG: VWA domain-containing protein [Deltaproteobacteria bacterium]|nr:VWA domain-containing protein [Deltaproteobacteria bacterium]